MIRINQYFTYSSSCFNFIVFCKGAKVLVGTIGSVTVVKVVFKGKLPKYDKIKYAFIVKKVKI